MLTRGAQTFASHCMSSQRKLVNACRCNVWKDQQLYITLVVEMCICEPCDVHCRQSCHISSVVVLDNWSVEKEGFADKLFNSQNQVVWMKTCITREMQMVNGVISCHYRMCQRWVCPLSTWPLTCVTRWAWLALGTTSAWGRLRCTTMTVCPCLPCLRRRCTMWTRKRHSSRAWWRRAPSRT